MVYLGGDNNLDRFGVKDLLEMLKIGSDKKTIHIVAQFDRSLGANAKRYYLKANRSLEECVIETIPEVNTGDPKHLEEFITWAAKKFPAQCYALVLWNHGAGWKDDDIYKRASVKKIHSEASEEQKIRSLSLPGPKRTFFAHSTGHPTSGADTRAILFDDTDADFLDSQELRSVLHLATGVLGRPIDLLGYDACLMSMLEVHYQTYPYAHVAVGSQEIEPGDGWPYADILEKLAADPEMSASDLGQVIVNCYVNHYVRNFPEAQVTQSATSLDRIEPLAESVTELADRLEKDTSPLTDRIVYTALRKTQTFTDRDYIDYFHFCQLLAQIDTQGELGKLGDRICQILSMRNSPIIASQHHGDKVANSKGISIYFPLRSLSSQYSNLEFAKRTRWDQFIRKFVSASG